MRSYHRRLTNSSLNISPINPASNLSYHHHPFAIAPTLAIEVYLHLLAIDLKKSALKIRSIYAIVLGKIGGSNFSSKIF